MTATQKSVCLGRYLVDVPVEAEVELSGGVVDGFDIVTVEESEAEFRDGLKAREAEAEAQGRDSRLFPVGGLEKVSDPRIPGMVGRGFFADASPLQFNEHIVMHLGLPRHPDLVLTLFVLSGSRSGPGLLERVARTDAEMNSAMLMRMSRLRSGRRNINGVDGEEVLVRAREFNFATTYGFSWESPSASDDLMRPFMSLELQAGMSPRAGSKPVNASLHEDAVLALWDKVAPSICLRKKVGALQSPLNMPSS
jgi:hypothetical protein